MSINFLKVQIRFAKPPGKLVRFLVLRGEYDRSNRYAYEGQVIGLSMQLHRGAFFLRGAGSPSPPPAGAGAAELQLTAVSSVVNKWGQLIVAEKQ